jgi:hypothetical protein
MNFWGQLVAQLVLAPLAIAAPNWAFVPSQSGPTNYYSVVSEGGQTFLRSQYKPGMKTAVMGWQTPDADRRRAKRVQWAWRAQTLPKGGDECNSDKADSAAVVYLSFKGTLRYYTLKYVWSAVSPLGAVCDKKRNPFVAQDTIVLETGGPTGAWKTEDIDLAAEYRKHFEGGDPKADVPAFVGIGLMSDGDETKSESSADFGAFSVLR